MKLSKALKLKNRFAGEVSRLQVILQRENARRSDSTSAVDRSEIISQLTTVKDKLTAIKTAIAVANVGIYGFLAQMEELKASISFYQALPIREGEELAQISYSDESGSVNKVSYTWKSYFTQEQIDNKVKELQTQIEELQDKVDEYNATTEITF